MEENLINCKVWDSSISTFIELSDMSRP